MELSVILVNYNDRRHLEDCLLSVKQSVKNMDYEIIIVDNHSSDGSQEYIAGNFPEVKLISNKENRGFAQANNQALQECQGEFVLFLNTDTVIFPGALDLLLAELRTSPEVGAVGPALLRRNRSYQVSFGRKVNFFSELFQRIIFNSYWRAKLKLVKRRKEAGWLSAACLLSWRELLKDLGGFDLNYFLYFEDIDLCLRMKSRGWKLVYLPQAQVFHEGGATTSPRNLWSRYEYRKSQLYFYRKHNSKFSLFLLWIYLQLNFWILSAKGSFRKAEFQDLREKYFRLLKNTGR